MKSRLVLALLLLTLEACLPVEDLGDYWSKAGRDPGLAGTWRIVEGPNTGRMVRKFVDTGEAYQLSNFSPAGQLLNPEPRQSSIRTLEIGRYKLLVFAGDLKPDGKRKGGMVRYKLEGDSLEIILMDGSSWRMFAQTRYPKAANLTKNGGEGDYLDILTFDAQVARMISEVPDTDEFWHSFEKLARIR
jgi:hypothetical protein